MSSKRILPEFTEKPPPDTPLSGAIAELEFRLAVEQGLAELDQREGVPIEEVKSTLAEWAGR